jgi:hypothetical protein
MRVLPLKPLKLKFWISTLLSVRINKNAPKFSLLVSLKPQQISQLLTWQIVIGVQ